ncbi:MAG: helix-turn-helix domain-containing protein [Clostridia bacterium]|nr:helix-turn-helix domain-containing protein [Clostridia bacterium]
MTAEKRYFEKHDINIREYRDVDAKTHKHEFFEIAYITDGEILHTLNGNTKMLKKGNFYIIDYDTEHSYVTNKNIPFRIINVIFKPKFMDNTLVNCRSFNTLIEHYLIKFNKNSLSVNPANMEFFDDDGSVRRIVDQMLDENTLSQPGYVEVLRSYLIALIITIMRKIVQSETTDDIITHIYDVVDRSISNPPSLNEIAQDLNYSPYYLSSKFKKLTGIGYRDYLTKRKIQESIRLLANTDKTISDIAELVGYKDMNSFYLSFKKINGVSPAVYRKKIK